MKPKPTPAAARPPLVFNLPALCARAYLQHLAGNSKPGKRLEQIAHRCALAQHPN